MNRRFRDDDDGISDEEIQTFVDMVNEAIKSMEVLTNYISSVFSAKTGTVIRIKVILPLELYNR